MTKWTLNVCTYNVMLTVPEPVRFNGQALRAKRIPERLAAMSRDVQELDVIVFVELIAPNTRAIVIDEMKKLGWPYVSTVLSKNAFFSSLKIVSGGIVVVSKYPIIYQYNYVFENACEGYDCTACKGVVFCRIQKGTNIFNVVSTHFQAWDTPTAQKIRQSQAEDCAKIINSMNIPNDEPVIFLGDLNIDFYSRQTEIQKLCNQMSVKILDRKPKSHPFSSDPNTNKLMGNDEDIMYATDIYPNGCYSEYMATMTCPCCPQEWLDYVAYSTEHLAPSSAEMFVYKLKAQCPFRMNFNISTERIVDDLSDHYPVIGTFNFNKETPFENRPIRTSLPDQNIISNKWKTFFVLMLGTISIAILFLFYLKGKGPTVARSTN